MRTQWTSKENRDAGSSCSCDRGFRWYLRNFGGGLNTPNPPFRYATVLMLYGSETRKVAKTTTSKLQTFINRCLRKSLNIHWPAMISNEELWRRTEETEISIQIKRRKWNWIGHTLRKGNEVIEREALDWNPQGKRRRGRPKQTWRRSVHNEALEEGKNWGEVKKLARNRIRWQRFVDALCPYRG